MSNARKIPLVDEPFGAVRVHYVGDQALHFTQDQGTFEGEGVSGTFCSTVGSAALIVRIKGGGVYEMRSEDFVRACVEHHKQRSKP